MLNLNLKIEIIDKLLFLIEKESRYKIVYGGRGGGKSHTIARALIIISLTKKTRILCAREIQKSIADSVLKLLKDIIRQLKLSNYFKITKDSIISVNGSEFMLKGLKSNIDQVKSIEAVDIVWIEEADRVSEESWLVLIPTIRKQGSEIWASFNPKKKEDPVYQRFVLNKRDDAIVVKINYNNNPYFPETLEKERVYERENDFERYLHVWEGEIEKTTDAQIFKNKYEVREFKSHPKEEVYANRYFFGMDFGYIDPLAVVRCYIYDSMLWIDYEAGGSQIDIDFIAAVIDQIPESRNWQIRADSSDPMIIDSLKNKGFRVMGAKKGAGSIERGILYLKRFKKIIIHERCEQLINEFKLYSYKVDKHTNEILPVIEGGKDHYIDALRYAMEGYSNKVVLDYRD